MLATGSASLPERATDLWPYVVGGALAPGVSQVLFVSAVRAIGSSRAGIVVGSAPLVSGGIAIVALEEPLRAALVAGTILVVLGGGLLALERGRPAHLRPVGALLAFLCAVFFGIRDNVVRWAAGESAVSPTLAAAVVLGSGGAVLACYLLAKRGRSLLPALRGALPPFALSGAFFGLAYLAILEALERGAVTVVAPLVATESLWTVLFAAVLLSRTELVGRRVVGAALLVVAGGALVGAWRS